MTQQKPKIWPPMVRPSGIHRVGDYLRMSWGFMNIANEVVKDVRLDIRVPASIAVIARETRLCGTARKDRALEEHEKDQVVIGDIAAGESVWLDVALRAVFPSSEDDVVSVCLRRTGGEPVDSAEIPVKVRGRSNIAVDAPKLVSQKAEPNKFAVLYSFSNVGTRVARDVVLRVPAPPGFSIARIMLENPREGVTDNEHEFVRELYFPSIESEHEEKIGLEFVATNDALGDAVELAGAVVSFDGGESIIPAAALRLSPHIDFSRSHLVLDADTVNAGQILRVRLNVANIGRSDARDVPVAFVLPDELIYAPGTLSINGGADARRNDLGNIVLPILRGRSIAEIAFNASVRAPLENGTRITIVARVDELDVDAVDIDVESQPYFPLTENYVDLLDEPTSIYADSPRTLTVRIHNAGTDVGDNVRLRLTVSDLAIDRVQIIEDDGKTTTAGVATVGGNEMSSMVDLGSIPPGETRRAKIVVRAPEAFPNNTFFDVRAFLRVGEAEELEIGGATLHGCSAPKIDPERSEIRAMRDDEFRIGQTRSVMLRLENTGSADAFDVDVDLDLPATIALRDDNGEIVPSQHVRFDRIPARRIAEATVRLELVAAPERELSGGIEIHPIVSCHGTSSFRMKYLKLLTTSRAIIDNVRIDIKEVDNNEALVTLHATNSGDRAARNVIVTLADTLVAYVPTSTVFTLHASKDSAIRPNTYPVRDCAGNTMLAKGFLLPEFSPGSQIAIAFRVNIAQIEEFSVAFEINSESHATIATEIKRYRKLHQRRALVGDIDDLVLSGPRIVGSRMVPRALQIDRTVLGARIPVALPPGQEPSTDAASDAPSPELPEAVTHEDLAASYPISESSEDAHPAYEPAAAVASAPSAVGQTADETLGITATGYASDQTQAQLIGEDPVAQATSQTDELHMEPTASADDESSPSLRNREEENKPVNMPLTLDVSRDLTHPVIDEPTTEDEASSSEQVPATVAVADEAPQSEKQPIVLKTAFGITQLNEVRLRKIAHFLEVLAGKESDLGMYRHILAMRLFLPDGIMGVSNEDIATYANTILPLAVTKQTKMLALVATNSFVLTPMMATSFEGQDVADAAFALREIADRASRKSFTVKIEPNNNYLVATFGTSYLSDYKSERPTGGHFHRMLAELVPNHSVDYPEIGEALAAYRSLLIEELDQFVYQSPMPRHESLRRASTSELDVALSRVGRAFGAREYVHE